jgi:hypothetical protein
MFVLPVGDDGVQPSTSAGGDGDGPAPAGASRELTGYVAEHLGRLAMMVVIVDRKTA